MATVYEEVAGCRPRAEEGSPPPVVVFSAEVEITEQNGGLGACDHQNHKHEKQETKHVVHL